VKATVHVVRALLFALCLVAGVLGTPAALAYVPPSHDGYVTDTSGKLTAADERAIEDEIASYRARTKHEIAVFVVGSMQGENVEDVAYTTFNTWGVGRKEEDDGVLLVIAPAERKMRIETGKGVGHLLTDIQSSHMLDERVRPLLRQERRGDAVMEGVKGIEEALGSAPVTARRGRAHEDDRDAATLLRLILWGGLAFAAFGVLAFAYRRRGIRLDSSTSSQDGSYDRRRRDWEPANDSSTWGSTFTGSDSGGSSSGGGDFGGGSSGGGGASSDW
jgi:uncharacterized protein